jgi:hypothetical protein
MLLFGSKSERTLYEADVSLPADELAFQLRTVAFKTRTFLLG